MFKRIAAVALALSFGNAHAQVQARTDDTTYHDNIALWVLGQVAQSTNLDTGLVESSTTYDPASATPVESRAFGAVQSVDTYWSVGVLRTSADASGNVTSFGHYRRGIPQRIVLADGEMKTAVVDAVGQITSVTDETGATTCHAFDAMGRLARIRYPSETASHTCDDRTWNETDIAFVSVPHPEYNIPAGHWRRTVRTGAGVTQQFFDAFWRPIVDVQHDANNVADTASHTVTHHDAAGNVVFRSYPVRQLGDAFARLPGMRTTYDALDRPVRVEQDAEFGVLTATTDYLPGFQVRATNPRGHATTTTYLAYDTPSFDQPLWIVEPEDTVTEIARDTFGKPTVLKRRNHANTTSVSRLYTYDAHQRLCKSIEPETQATVYDYDAAGNVRHSASGLALPVFEGGAQCEMDRAIARTAEQGAHRAYNRRNQPVALTFSDGRGDQTLAYTKDGLLERVTTWNDAWHSSAVDNTWTYNNRRLLVEEGSAQHGWYDWRLQYGYDANGHLASQRFPDGNSTLHFGPDALGRATAVWDHAGNPYATDVKYYPNGAVQQFTYGNGVAHAMEQNARQLPARVVDGHVSDVRFGYDANANPTTIREARAVHGVHTGTRDLYYDGRDRLVGANLEWLANHRFSYDPFDNITSHARFDGAWSTRGYLYDGAHRLTNLVDTATGASVMGLGYDAQGNLRNKDGQGYDFDHGNRLRAVTGKESYRYDANGRRVPHGARKPAASCRSTATTANWRTKRTAAPACARSTSTSPAA